MNPRAKKLLVRTSIIIAAILVCTVGTAAIAVNFILTPDKLTPIVMNLANEYINGTVTIGRIEATVFSSYPRLGIVIEDGCVVSNSLHQQPDDTTRTRRDTLATFDRARLGIDIGHYLATGKINVGRIDIDHPRIRLHRNADGVANWDIMKQDTTATDTVETENASFSLRRLNITNARIRYTDRTNNIRFNADSLTLTAHGDMSLEKMDMELALSNKRTSLRVDDTRYLRRLPLGIEGKIEYDAENEFYKLADARFNFGDNSADIGIDGWFRPDTAGVDIDITFGLEAPDAKKVFDLIPKSLVDRNINISNGIVGLQGTVKGRRAEGQFPVVTCNLNIDKISAQYEGMPYGIDELTTQFDALIDPAQPTGSYMNLEIFHFKGGKSEVEAFVKMSRLFDNPAVDCQLKSHVDLASLTEVFPVENTTMSGIADADIRANFNLSDIRAKNFGRIVINGSLHTDSIRISNDSTQLYVSNNLTDMTFSGQDTLSVSALLSNLRIKHPSLRLGARNIGLNAQTLMQPDTTAIVTLKCDVGADRFFMKTDTIVLFGKNIFAHNVVRPSEADKTKPYVEIALKTDTLFSGIFGTRGRTERLNSLAVIELKDSASWASHGFVEFDRIVVGTPAYKLPIVATDTRISQNYRTISIDKSNIRAGESTLSISGKIHNLYKAITDKREQFAADISLTADTLNFNQLMAAMVETDSAAAVSLEQQYTNDTTMVVATAAPDSISADSIPMRMFAVPKRVNINIAMKANNLAWSKLRFEDVKGDVKMANGSLHMTNLMFKQQGARAISTLAYKAEPRQNTGKANVFVRWERADIGMLIDALELDTVMPMLSPLRGKVDCYVAAELDLDSALNVNTNTANAAMHIGAQKLTLMDGDTFAKISKVLMFKNKKENIIDTLALNILLDSGQVRILPFAVTVDRYRAAIGGSQDLDMNLDYHISILKSPLPFKAGVNITGTPDNIDIDITTAKLKKQITDDKLKANDQASLDKRIEILRNSYKLSGLPLPEALRPKEEAEE